MASLRKRLYMVIVVLTASMFTAAVPGCTDSTGPDCFKSGKPCFVNADCCTRACVATPNGRYLAACK